jgi:hypothetical protein
LVDAMTRTMLVAFLCILVAACAAPVPSFFGTVPTSPSPVEPVATPSPPVASPGPALPFTLAIDCGSFAASPNCLPIVAAAARELIPGPRPGWEAIVDTGSASASCRASDPCPILAALGLVGTVTFVSPAGIRSSVGISLDGLSGEYLAGSPGPAPAAEPTPGPGFVQQATIVLDCLPGHFYGLDCLEIAAAAVRAVDPVPTPGSRAVVFDVLVTRCSGPGFCRSIGPSQLAGSVTFTAPSGERTSAQVFHLGTTRLGVENFRATP